MASKKRKVKLDTASLSEAVKKTKNKAEEYARDPQKAKHLLESALKKAKGYEA